MTFGQVAHIAHLVGFDACGVATPFIDPATVDFMKRWVRNDLPPKLHYLTANEDKRYDPTRLVDGVKSVIVCLLSYQKCKKDYHRTIKSMLYTMQTELQSLVREQNIVSDDQHVFCDSAPVLERYLAVRAGLGWIGKNRQLIHPTLGAMTHIGELFLNISIEASVQSYSSQCYDCSLCVDICPQEALSQTRWQPDRCLAFTDNKCTLCQQVCPFNPPKLR